MVLGKLCHVKQWPNQSSYTCNHLIAKKDEYHCHAKQWPTPTSGLWHAGNKCADSRMTGELVQKVICIWALVTCDSALYSILECRDPNQPVQVVLYWDYILLQFLIKISNQKNRLAIQGQILLQLRPGESQFPFVCEMHIILNIE